MKRSTMARTSDLGASKRDFPPPRARFPPASTGIARASAAFSPVGIGGVDRRPRRRDALSDGSFRTRPIWRVCATCDVDYLASAHVLEKVGMTREGCLSRYVLRPNIARETRDAFITVNSERAKRNRTGTCDGRDSFAHAGLPLGVHQVAQP